MVFTRRQTIVAIVLLIMLNSVSVKSAKVEGESAGMRPSGTIVSCVLRDPSQGRLLKNIDATKQLYTHRCSGGIYLIDSTLSHDGLFESAVPVVQGWWLDSIMRVYQPDMQSIVVDGRFITGVGPRGAQPFYARIRLIWGAGVWQVEEPVLLESPIGMGGDKGR